MLTFRRAATFLIFMLPLYLDAKELRLCGVAWPPYTLAENGKIVGGLSHEVYTEAFNRMGISWTVDEVPWARCLMYVKMGRYDAVIDNASLQPFITGRNPTAHYALAIYVRSDFPQNEFSWEMLRGKVVGVVRGYDYTKVIRDFDGWIKEPATTDELMLLKLHAKRYDYVLLDVYSASTLSEKAGVQIKMLNPLVDSTNLYLAFNSVNKSHALKYDQVISEMIKDGTMDLIYRSHFSFTYKDLFK